MYFSENVSYTKIIEGNCSTICVVGARTTVNISCTGNSESEFQCKTVLSSTPCLVSDESCLGK